MYQDVALEWIFSLHREAIEPICYLELDAKVEASNDREVELDHKVQDVAGLNGRARI